LALTVGIKVKRERGWERERISVVRGLEQLKIEIEDRLRREFCPASILDRLDALILRLEKLREEKQAM
jgi:hypothetical protein